MKNSSVLFAVIFSTTLLFSGSVHAVQAQEQPIFSFRVTVPTGYEREYAAALVIKDSLAQFGIDMGVVREDAGTFFAKIWGADTYRLTFSEGGWDADSYWWYWRPEDMLFFSSFTSRGFPPDGWNEWSYNNGYAQDMLLAATRTYDKTERTQYYWKFAEEFQRDPAFIALYYFDVCRAARASIENYDPILYTANAADWKMKGKTEADLVTVRIAIPYTENVIDPLFGGTSSMPNYATIAPVYPQLLKSQRQPDGTYAVVPDLAESYEISQDGLAITFHLRKGVTWSDGRQFTAEDVRVTYEGMLDPTTGVPALADLRDIERIEILDDYNFVFHLKQPNALLLAALGGYIAGGIIPAHVFGQVAHDKWRGYWTEPSQIVSLGAYRMVDFVPNERVVLEANPDYWKGKPFVDRIEMVVIAEPTTAISALKTGEVDILVAEYTGPELLAELPNLEGDPTIDASFVPWPATSYFGFNLNHPVLTNRYVRLAIANLIPIDTIIKDALKGHGRAANGPIYSGSWAYNPNLPPMAQYNPEKAKEYLTMAGLIRPSVMPTEVYYYVAAALVIGLAVGAGIGFMSKKRMAKQTG